MSEYTKMVLSENHYISGEPTVSVSQTTNADDCASTCQANVACRRFTYNSNNNSCALYHADFTGIPRARGPTGLRYTPYELTSGRKVDIDESMVFTPNQVISADTSYNSGPAKSEADCGNLCLIKGDCGQATWNGNQKICSLHKKGLGTVVPGQPGYSAGVLKRTGQYAGGKPGLHQYPTDGKSKFTCPVKYPGLLLPYGSREPSYNTAPRGVFRHNVPCGDSINWNQTTRSGGCVGCQYNHCELKDANDRGRTAKNAAAVKECCEGKYSNFGTGEVDNSFCPTGACPWGPLCDQQTVEYCSRVKDGKPLIAPGGDKNCINWCESNPGSCDSIKRDFCTKNPTHKLCACIAPKSNSAYAKFMQIAREGMSTLGLSTNLGPYECWWPGCVGELDVFRTQENKNNVQHCPANTFNICAQVVKVKGNDARIDHNTFKQICGKDYPKPPAPAPTPKPAGGGGSHVVPTPTPIVPAGPGDDDDFWTRVKKRLGALEDKVHSEEEVLGITDYLKDVGVSQKTADYALTGTALVALILVIVVIYRLA